MAEIRCLASKVASRQRRTDEKRSKVCFKAQAAGL